MDTKRIAKQALQYKPKDEDTSEDLGIERRYQFYFEDTKNRNQT
jgi:hypothetical protein